MTNMNPDPLHLICRAPETGVWCDRCALPSAIRYPYNTLNSEGVGGGGTLTICERCAERNEENQ